MIKNFVTSPDCYKKLYICFTKGRKGYRSNQRFDYRLCFLWWPRRKWLVGFRRAERHRCRPDLHPGQVGDTLVYVLWSSKTKTVGSHDAISVNSVFLDIYDVGNCKCCNRDKPDTPYRLIAHVLILVQEDLQLSSISV